MMKTQHMLGLLIVVVVAFIVYKQYKEGNIKLPGGM